MTKLLLVTGKGGVGKSTTSASLAHYYAGQGLKTILISSDPAHSTDDTVGVKIGSAPQEIATNLWAMNIDATKAVSGRVTKVKEAFASNFPDNNQINLLAEPGRSLVSNSLSLVVKVNLRKKNNLYINDGLYGYMRDIETLGLKYPVKLFGKKK